MHAMESMRFLDGAEAVEAERFTAEAVTVARRSPCEKSKRGVIIVSDSEVIGRGYNKPPADVPCVEEFCGLICRKYCVHAETNAVMDALRGGHELKGSRGYHIKVKGGAVRDSDDLSCVPCAALVLESGMGEFVLKHPRGFAVYGAREFYELSLDAFIRQKSSNGK